jgi:hypothetical protein
VDIVFNMLASQSNVNYEFPATIMALPKTFRPGTFPQGHSTFAILTNIGDHYPVISDVGYRENKNVAPVAVPLKKGSRAMHSTTFTFEKSPASPEEFITSSKLVS